MPRKFTAAHAHESHMAMGHCHRWTLVKDNVIVMILQLVYINKIDPNPTSKSHIIEHCFLSPSGHFLGQHPKEQKDRKIRWK
jgi:hypothetical protein